MKKMSAAKFGALLFFSIGVAQPALSQQPDIAAPTPPVAGAVAAKVFRPFAERSRVEAEVLLGSLYLSGKGVSQNFSQARLWFGKAAEQNNRTSEFWLAIMNDQGLGLPKDQNAAAALFLKAAEEGFAEAQYAASVRYAKGIGLPLNPTAAARWAYRAAFQGSPQAQLALAKILSEGTGVQQDPVAAYLWASIATTSADATIKESANTLKQKLGGSLASDIVAQSTASAAGWRPALEAPGEPPPAAAIEKDGIAASLAISNGEAVVRWRFLRPLAAPITEISGGLDDQALGIPQLAPYPQPNDRTAVLLALDLHGADRASRAERDKTILTKIASAAGETRAFDMTVLADTLKIVETTSSDFRGLIDEAVSAPATQSPVKLGQALREAIELPALAPARRRGIFVITDGRSEEVVDPKTIIDSARRSGVSISFILDVDAASANTASLREIAEGTGGVLVTQDQLSDFEEHPFDLIDSGATARFPLAHLHRSDQHDPEVKIAFRYGDERLELKAAVPNEAVLERDALRSAIDGCGPSCSTAFKKQVEDRIDLISSEAATYRDAHDDLSLLGQYAGNCLACNFRSEALARSRALTEERWYARLEAAGSDPDALEQFAKECAGDCSDQLRADAQSRLETARASQAERIEAQTYQEARGDAAKLDDYVSKCKVCAFEEQARADIAEIKQNDVDSKMFTFEVCNKTAARTSVAITGRTDPDTNDWTVAGWWTIEPDSCDTVGKFVRGHFYYMAVNNDDYRIGWRGADKKLCVSKTTFTRINKGGACDSDDPLEGFYDHVVNEGKLTWTLNP